MMDVKSLNPNNRTRLSTPRLDGDEQSRYKNGYGESYSSKEKSYWP